MAAKLKRQSMSQRGYEKGEEGDKHERSRMMMLLLLLMMMMMR
jgi:hypothetical protein